MMDSIANKPLKVGVVGTGAMGRNHARIYSQQNCELVGVADISLESAREIGEKYGVPYYKDYTQLLSKVDAVSIAVPTTLHCKVATDFLKAGIHCLVEKPVASRLEEANEMIELARQKNVILAVGQIERFNPVVIRLKEIIDEGTLGKILIISTRRVGPEATRIRDVGVVIDSATHDICVATYLLGKEPIGVFARTGNFKHTKEDHAIILLDFPENTTACIEANWFTPHKIRTLVATGSQGIANLDYIDQSLVIQNSEGIRSEHINKEEPLKLEIIDFLSSVAESRKPAVDGKEGLDILKIALEATKSSAT